VTLLSRSSTPMDVLRRSSWVPNLAIGQVGRVRRRFMPQCITQSADFSSRIDRHCRREPIGRSLERDGCEGDVLPASTKATFLLFRLEITCRPPEGEGVRQHRWGYKRLFDFARKNTFRRKASSNLSGEPELRFSAMLYTRVMMMHFKTALSMVPTLTPYGAQPKRNFGYRRRE